MGLCRGVACACACEYQPSFVSAIFHTIQTVLSLTLFLYETVIVYIWPDEGTSCQKLPLPSPPPFPTSRVILSRSGTRKSWLTCVSSAQTSFQRSPLIIYRQLHVLTFCPLNHNFAAFFFWKSAIFTTENKCDLCIDKSYQYERLCIYLNIFTWIFFVWKAFAFGSSPVCP